jgi:ribosomal protein S18 acetylase RimI-like enzyme
VAVKTPAAALRRAEPADAEGLAALHHEVWDESPEDLTDWLHRGGALVLEDEKRIVAAVLWLEEAGGWRLDRLATLPGYRGRGFGRWLMTKVEALAIRENIPAVFLYVEKERHDLLGYYRRMGYRVTEEEETRLLLRKPIGGSWQYKERG